MDIKTIVAALLIFTVIVVFHELGHFLLAVKNGIFVTEFSVGMGLRLITVVKTKEKWNVKFFMSSKEMENHKEWEDYTKYSIKLFPLGGSCMMLGEDEELDREDAFNKKGVWARFSAIVAGPLFNFILAFVLSVIIIGIGGIDLPYIARIYSGRPAESVGLMEGDKVISVAGKKVVLGRDVDIFSSFDMADYDQVEVVVERDGKEISVTLDVNYETYLFGFYYLQDDNPAEISSVSENMPFAEAGIQAGDVITAIDGTPITSGKDLEEYVAGVTIDENAKLEFTYERDGKEKTTVVEPTYYEGKTLGMAVGRITKVSPLEVIRYSFSEVRYWIVSTVRSLGQLIVGKLSAKDLTGAVGIVDMVGGVIEQSQPYGTLKVILNILKMSVLLSANLGVMNLLPIPALDGGRLVFILIEAIRGKPVDQEKEGLVHLIGFAFLMLLMIYVMYNDIMRIIGH